MRARLGNQIQHLCLQTRSGAGDDGPARVARMPIPVADYTAGGFDDWHQRLHIVCIQIHIQNDVDQSARKQTGAVTFGAVAHIARIAPHRAEGTAFARVPKLRWVADRHRRLRQRCACSAAERGCDAAAAPLRAPWNASDERFADVGLVHHAEDWALAIVQHDHSSPMQKPQDEIACAVYGIDEPSAALVAGGMPKLFPDIACSGKRSAKRPRMNSSALRSASVTG